MIEYVIITRWSDGVPETSAIVLKGKTEQDANLALMIDCVELCPILHKVDASDLGGSLGELANEQDLRILN